MRGNGGKERDAAARERMTNDRKPTVQDRRRVPNDWTERDVVAGIVFVGGEGRESSSDVEFRRLARNCESRQMRSVWLATAMKARTRRARMRLRHPHFVSSHLAPMFESLLTDRETQIRLLRFLVVGGGSALVQVAVLKSLKARCGENLAFSISWVVSTTTHYFANRYWALPSTRQDAAQQFGEYLVAVA